jgi:antitoxin VapB
MALYIADSQTSELAEELSKLLGTTKTDAVRRALREELARQKRKANFEAGMQKIQAVIEESSQLLDENKMTQKEMDEWLYDENGLPR